MIWHHLIQIEGTLSILVNFNLQLLFFASPLDLKVHIIFCMTFFNLLTIEDPIIK